MIVSEMNVPRSQKINYWYSCNRKNLLDSGLSINDLGTQPDGTKAEITIGVEERRRIVNFDETDHPFSTINGKKVSRSVSWDDPNLTGGTTKGTRGSRYTTSIYGSNVAGEAMPPIY